MGKYFAEIGKLVKTPTLTMREIASELEIPITTVPAPLKKLIRLGYVEKTGKSYRIRFSQIENFLNEIARKHGERDEKKMKMAINKQIIIRIIESGFFDSGKNLTEVVDKLDTIGFTINKKQKPRLAQLLTQLCREEKLEREKLPKSEWNRSGGKFIYKKKEQGDTNERTNN